MVHTKEQHTAYMQEYRGRKREAAGVVPRPRRLIVSVTPPGSLQTCRTCGAQKPIGDYSRIRHPSGLESYRRQCKQCDGRLRQERRRANPLLLKAAREAARRASRKRRSTPAGWGKRIVSLLRHKAARLGIVFTLTAADVMAVMPADGRCPALGIPFVFGVRSPANPSVDRIRPALGYVAGNIAVISRRANAIKQDATAVELAMVAAWAEKAESKVL